MKDLINKYFNRKVVSIIAIAFSLPLVMYANEIHVSINGNDANIGTKEKPLRTIQAAVDKINPGDICIIHNGTYRENIKIKNSGDATASITIRAAMGEHPIISGLDVLDLKWKATDKKGIYVAEYKNSNLEQLFIDGKPLLEARWPNVPKDKNGDWDFFSPDQWAIVDSTGNHYGTIKDRNLAATGWNVTGAAAVLNVCHQFFTWTRIVEGHNAGSDSFNYPKNLGKSIKPADETGAGLKFNDDRYYLVGKKEFLDAPGEWFYDKEKKQLYLYTTDGINPEKKLLEVKTRYYSLTAEDDKNFIIIDGITFFGTAFRFGKDQNHRSHHLLFENNKVLYSSWTEFLNMPDDDARVKLDKNFPTIHSDNVILSTNMFSYGSLSALFINGFNNVIENNVFNDFDLSSSLVYPTLVVSKNSAGFEGKGGKAIVRYNTIYNSGGILTQIAQNDNDVYLNDLHDAFKSCYGGNRDVSALYTQSIYCKGTRFHHNWVHDSYGGTPPLDWNGGIGIRGDDNTCGLTVDHNVVWNMGSAGIMMKNRINPNPEDRNQVFNNTIFKHSIYNPIKNAIIVTTDNVSKKLNENVDVQHNENEYSLINNNLAETITGGWFQKKIGKVADISNNCIGEIVETNLENADLLDFRPKSTATSILDKGKLIPGYTSAVFGNAPDIGAYERGDEIYWIPGRREIKATCPIVADNANINESRDALMWKPAYNAVAHQVYFGTIKEQLPLKSKLNGDKNIFKLPSLVEGKKYFWRVDAIMNDGSVVKGDVWSFNVKN